MLWVFLAIFAGAALISGTTHAIVSAVEAKKANASSNEVVSPVVEKENDEELEKKKTLDEEEVIEEQPIVEELTEEEKTTGLKQDGPVVITPVKNVKPFISESHDNDYNNLEKLISDKVDSKLQENNISFAKETDKNALKKIVTSAVKTYKWEEARKVYASSENTSTYEGFDKFFDEYCTLTFDKSVSYVQAKAKVAKLLKGLDVNDTKKESIKAASKEVYSKLKRTIVKDKVDLETYKIALNSVLNIASGKVEDEKLTIILENIEVIKNEIQSR